MVESVGDKPPPNRRETTVANKSKSKGKANATPKRTVAGVMRTLTAKRDTANKTNAKRKVKRHYTDEGAQYLAEAVALVLTKRPAKGIPAREWAITNPTECVIIDARKVVLKVKSSLYKRPENTIRARLISMATYAPQVSEVGYLRHLISGSPAITEGNANAYQVVLFRK